MIDYLIVGAGIAGISFAEKALQNGKSIQVLDDFSTKSSRVAGGLYNPVILKRFTEVWNAKEQLEFSLPFLNALEKKLDVSFDFKIPLYRKITSIEEQNNWFQASDRPNLAPFLSGTLITKAYPAIASPYGYGEVMHTGYVNLGALMDAYVEYLQSNNLFLQATFNASLLEIHDSHLSYNGMSFQNLIFAEGFGLKNNPYFNYLPLDGTKGELLIIKAPNLTLDVIIKSSVFLLPIGNDLYKVGATYNWTDKTEEPTQAGKAELLTHLKSLIQCDFEVIEHYAGVRPTVKDRRPLVGTHPVFKNLHVLNGLGTRGVMLGPWLANQLFNFINDQNPLDPMVSIDRFNKKLT